MIDPRHTTENFTVKVQLLALQILPCPIQICILRIGFYHRYLLYLTVSLDSFFTIIIFIEAFEEEASESSTLIHHTITYCLFFLYDYIF